ncbi:MAG: sigma-70 family RNA polymerase sigma factor [Acidobacteriota bacterium]|nr:sigma-70 family RNA polymerase sigma factor [Acidobacteriota bacterium]
MWKEADSEEDRLLITECRNGDERAFEKLVSKYRQTIMNLIYHYVGSRNDVEDIAQKIFSKIYFSIPKYDDRRPFFPWLYRIAINQCYDELRRIRRRRVHSFSELSIEDAAYIEKLISQDKPPLEAEETEREMYSILQKVLSQLPEQQKMSIVLRDIEGVSYGKMAEILNCTEQVARLKVFRARVRLKALVEKALRKR